MLIGLLILILKLFGHIHNYDHATSFNKTHVVVANEVYLRADCQYRNDTVNNTGADILPEIIINYIELVNHSLQSFYNITTNNSIYNNNEYKRYSCNNNSFVNCTYCSEYPEYVTGYKCHCARNKTMDLYRYQIYNVTWKMFQTQCKELEKECEKCDPFKTRSCIYDNHNVTCLCMEEYDSRSNCHEKYNPCLHAPIGSELSGNEACLTTEVLSDQQHYPNKCIPYIGQQNYICQCAYPNKMDKRLGFPNCMGPKSDKCDSIICINDGQCNRTSPDPDSEVFCHCKAGFVGKHCEVPLYEFIGWTFQNEATMKTTQWTACYPECGNYGLRSSDAECTGPLTTHCIGISRRWQRCAPISCDLQLLSNIKSRTIEGLRHELVRLSRLTTNEKNHLIYILILGGITAGLLYIVIIEIVGR